MTLRVLALLLAATFAFSGPAFAQGQGFRPLPGGGADAGAAAPGGGDPAIGRRLDRIEEQLIDLQSQTATLESLSGAGAAASSQQGSGFSGGDASSGRVAAMEGQLQALSGQMADIIQRLQQMERQLGVTPQRGALPDAGGSRFASREPAAPPQTLGRPPSSFDAQTRPGGPPPGNTFGSTSVEPDQRDGDRFGSGGFGGGATGAPANPNKYAVAPTALPPLDGATDATSSRPAALPPARASDPEARALYDQGYASLTRREYTAAETYFSDFVKRYPDDPLAGPAQFWLGEAAFVSGEYRTAADNFLKSYTNYPASDKAPESLLKLGISLRRLGQNSAACDSFSELVQKFPQAQQIAQRATAEKKRANC